MCMFIYTVILASMKLWMTFKFQISQYIAGANLKGYGEVVGGRFYSIFFQYNYPLSKNYLMPSLHSSHRPDITKSQKCKKYMIK